MFAYTYDFYNGIRNTCCFIGQKDFDESVHMINQIKTTLLLIIINDDVKNFIFTGKSKFDNICHRIVTELKTQYNDIKRIKYKSKLDYLFEPDIDDNKNADLLEYEEFVECDNLYFLEEMIDKSDICFFYLDTECLQQTNAKKHENTETYITYNYAIKEAKIKNKKLYNAFYSQPFIKQVTK